MDTIPDILIPNNTNFPSDPTAGIFAPYLGLAPNEIPNFSEIPENSAIGNDSFGFENTPQNPRNLLLALRSMFPHLPILPIPTNATSIVLTANQAKDIVIPDGAVLGIFMGQGGYFVSANGNAVIPTASSDNTSTCIYAPEGYAFYIGGKRSFSCISAVTGTIVTLLTYSFTELPR